MNTFKSHIVKRAWQYRRAAAKKYSCPLMEISWKECLALSMEYFSPETFHLENTHFAGKFADGWKFIHSAGTLENGILTLTEIYFGYWEKGKMTSFEIDVDHIMVVTQDMKGRVDWSGADLFTYAKKVVGNTYPYKTLLKEKGFKWNPTEKCWAK